MFFYQRQKIIKDKYYVFGHDVCKVTNVMSTIDIWEGIWITGENKGDYTYNCISKTSKKEWTKLFYVGILDYEIAHPFCNRCGEFLNIAYLGALRDENPKDGWFCEKCGNVVSI